MAAFAAIATQLAIEEAKAVAHQLVAGADIPAC